MCIKLSKGWDSEMTVHINLEFSGNDKGDNQLTKRQYLPTTTTTTTNATTTAKTTASVASTTKAKDIAINI